MVSATGRAAPWRTAAATAVVFLLAAPPGSPLPPAASAPAPHTITGSYAALLSSSADLGQARDGRVHLTAELRAAQRPVALTRWAHDHDLRLRWDDGAAWAALDGTADAVADAFGVAVHDYRGPDSTVFYASPQQPQVPAALRGEVDGLGRILGYTPFHGSRPPAPPLDVPDRGLSPTMLPLTYNIAPLRRQGFTGKGGTVVVFAFDGFDQSDLDLFSSTFGLPPFAPEVVGGMPRQRSGEATMDLEAIHAVAPDARTVLVNARPTVEGDASYQKIATMMDDVRARYPGAVWSLSIGWGCDKLITKADLAPVRAAVAAAHRTGTAAFDASGDLAGLECKGGDNWSTPPGPDEVGLDAVASMPEMTDVGGTTLSTDKSGGWLDEQTWFDVPLSQGTGGGVSALFARPDWQDHISLPAGAGRRLTPDISAVADPNTGVNIVFAGQVIAGGGTSLAAPIWAGIAAVINQYLTERGGRLLGDLNPLLYEASLGARLPGFHDIPLGANAVERANSGYDLVTGLGTPNVANLAEDLLAVQRARGDAK